MFIVNGENKEFRSNMTVEAFILKNGFPLSRIAVERNGVIIPKTQYSVVFIEDHDVIEIVSFVGGG